MAIAATITGEMRTETISIQPEVAVFFRRHYNSL